jgi:peptide/nickel transport system permease protein
LNALPEPGAKTIISATDEDVVEETERNEDMGAPTHRDVRTGRSPGRVAWDRLKVDKVAIVCTVIIVFFILVALFAPLLYSLQAVDSVTGAEADPYTVHTELVDFNGLPTVGASPAHWLGVEPRLGRDLFARWAVGARPSLIIGFVAAAVSTLLGVTLGLLAGYVGGWTDRVITWVTDFFLSLPILLLVIAIVPIMQKSIAGGADLTAEQTSSIRFYVLIAILIVFGWMGLARLVRGEVKSLREREFVQAARAIGVPTGRSSSRSPAQPGRPDHRVRLDRRSGIHHLRGDAQLSGCRARGAHRVLGPHHRGRPETSSPPTPCGCGPRSSACRCSSSP